ncbi:MAG: lamin tail domain-containing protein [Pontiellaceae bacterium]|nr:lamin tail domain-containing protein [Pontiellaceae bacterium]
MTIFRHIVRSAFMCTLALSPSSVLAQIRISEFMASNSTTLMDEDGEYVDWIELQNTSPVTVDLCDWALTDNQYDLSKWKFPSTNMPPGAFLVVFASNKDRRIPGEPLHTSFKLDADGGYLALVDPSGNNVCSEFAPAYPSQVPDVSFGFASSVTNETPVSTDAALYFTHPTPGEENMGGAFIPGPGIADVLHVPNIPFDDDDILVTAKVFPTAHPVAQVMLHYRVMFEGEVAVSMFDDGAHGDGAPGDGIYGAIIPAGAGTTGQMLRYYITAEDTNDATARLPVFTDPASTAEYFGTVIDPGYVESGLPVVHLFAPPSVLQPGPTTTQTGADSDAGARISLYFDGEFYDNVLMFLRGNTTAVYDKKSHRIRFNTEHTFRHNEGGGRLKNTSFVADYSDPTYMRQGLSYWLCNEIGAPGPFYAPYRLQLNGAFYQLANHNDVHGEEILERLGYDPNGALYNAMGTIEPPTILADGTWEITSNGGWEKKTRRWDTENLDYIDLAAAISGSLSTGQRMKNIFDRLDLPEVINYMVAARIANESDDVRANMSLYHDNDGDDLWRIIPFDMNLSWGASYYLNSDYDGIQVANDLLKCHPFYGASKAIPPDYNWNRLYDVIISVPQTREMYLRRMRTVLDEYVLPPGTPPEESPIYQKAIEWLELIGDDAMLDRAWWGWPAKGGQGNFNAGIDPANGVAMLLNDYLDQRRQHLYGKHSVTNTALAVGITKYDNAGIPLPQPDNALLSIVSWDYNPVSGNQEEEYVQLSNANNYALDISGWELDGGIRFTFSPGTVVPANSSIYVSPNTRAFRARSTGPRGGEGLFVVGPCEGHLDAWGESLVLFDGNRMVSSNSYVGMPSPEQQYLRITEIMYNPLPTTDSSSDVQQFEYVELKNISTSEALDLDNVRFSDGIDFNFSDGSITHLAPGETVLLVRNRNAFIARYGDGFNIAGEFSAALENSGETLRLEDAVGEKILEFAYDDSWYPITDGLGFSLAIVDENAPRNTWGNKLSWRASGETLGSPGTADPAPPEIGRIIVNEALTHTDLPALDSVELHNPTANAVNIGGWFLTDDFFAPRKYRIPDETILPPDGYCVFDESDFNQEPHLFRFSELGDSVYLFSADANGDLTGYSHGYEFGEAPNGVSFGRYLNSEEKEFFTLQSGLTLGGSNAYPRVGPLVISEIMYHPQDANGVDNNMNEFIELQNISAAEVLLYDPETPANTWRLRNAVDYDFPVDQSLPGGERLLVVGFDPADSAQLAAFRSRHDVPDEVPIYGPWSGTLDNSGETIELKQPDKPDVLSTNVIVPFIMIDKVGYRDELPWPDAAAGLGNALQRRVDADFGNDPANWFAAGVTAGRANVANLLPYVSIASPTNGTLILADSSLFVSVEAGDDDGSVALVQLFVDDMELVQWSAMSSNVYWSNPPVGTHELIARATDNLGAVAESKTVVIHVVAPLPEVAILSPASGAILARDTFVNLSVAISEGGQASSVDYFLDGEWIGSAGPPFSLPWSATPLGTHTLSAVGSDFLGRRGPVAETTFVVQNVTENPVRIPFGATGWKYLDDGSDQGGAWRKSAFNDASWSSGQAQFGYGDGDETTTISYGPDSSNKYRTYYFRKTFVVPSLAGITNAVLSVLRDDGAIAYVNGIEVFRSNMPSGSVNYRTAASDAVSGSDEDRYYSVGFDPSLLMVGTNVLAVEVHQVSSTSSDLSFDAQLALQGVWRGPAFLVQPTNQTVAVGSNVDFSVSVTGSEPVSLSWYFNNTPLPADRETLTLTNVRESDAGEYYVVASNFMGAATSSVAVLVVDSFDTDGDGMPDAWEQANGTDPMTNDAADDPDLDGLSNIQEYIAGTQPTNALSVLKFDSIGFMGTNVEFSFDAVANHSYAIQFRPSLDSGNWQTWTVIPSMPTDRTLWLTNRVHDDSTWFIRIVTPAEP